MGVSKGKSQVRKSKYMKNQTTKKETSASCLKQVLGMGNFGKVMQATAYGNNGKTTNVAVKMLKDSHTDQVKLSSR